MKTLIQVCLLLGLLSILSFYSCTKTEMVQPQSVMIQSEKSMNHSSSLHATTENGKYISIPFKAKFTTSGAEDAFTQPCEGEGPNAANGIWLLDHQVGEGNATHLGKFDFDMTFCFHLVFDENGNPDWENGMGEVVNSFGSLVAANGDILFLSAPTGQVNPIIDPVYGADFSDPFFFDGGTGRFEGATGSGTSFGQVVLGEGGYSDHLWTGTLKLPK